MSDPAPAIVCLASYFKGADFIHECKQLGCHVSLIIKEKLQGEEWPRESLDALLMVPDAAGIETYVDVIAGIARERPVAKVVALEEFDVLTAGAVRDHFLLPGQTQSQARLFRDKLSMRTYARRAGILVPDFVALVNHDQVRAFMDRVPPPWVLKPRSDVSAIGIRLMRNAGEVWRAIEELNGAQSPRDRASYFHLEQFVAGGVYHVDSLVSERRLLFAGINRYRRPPMEIAHHGGIFVTQTVEHGSPDAVALQEINGKLLQTLGLETGVAHAEFIKGDATGQFYFLEVAARVGGAYIADVLDAASGINIWREWARLETATAEQPYTPPSPKQGYAGIALTLARQEWPDSSGYTDPEIVHRVKKRYHAGLIVASNDYARVTGLLDDYARRFMNDFEAVLPPPARPE